MTQPVVVPGNLGSEFDLGVQEASLITLRVGRGLSKGVDGKIHAAFRASAVDPGPIVGNSIANQTLLAPVINVPVAGLHMVLGYCMLQGTQTNREYTVELVGPSGAVLAAMVWRPNDVDTVEPVTLIGLASLMAGAQAFLMRVRSNLPSVRTVTNIAFAVEQWL